MFAEWLERQQVSQGAHSLSQGVMSSKGKPKEMTVPVYYRIEINFLNIYTAYITGLTILTINF